MRNPFITRRGPSNERYVTPSNGDLLAYVVRAAEDGDRGVPATAIADRFGLDPQACRDRLETLADCELVAATEEGYRPTVTGRELLELPTEGDVVIVDPAEE